MSRSASLDLATLSCDKFENEVLTAAATDPGADSINTVMWLFGYSVAKSGAHVMYADALAPFGFALDNECKSNPAESLLDALSVVKPETKHPMDLTRVECSTFAARHNRGHAHGCGERHHYHDVVIRLFGGEFGQAAYSIRTA